MTDGEIREVTVPQLIKAVEETRHYAFLVGAGTSRPDPAGIPTAGELVDRWREECHERADTDLDLDDWVESEETDINGAQRYGFWFEKRHPSRGQRREHVRDLVEGAEPTPYHIILASLMSRGDEKRTKGNSDVFVPHTLTRLC